MVVSSLGLNGLDNEGSNGTVRRASLLGVDNGLFNGSKRGLLSLSVLPCVLREGVLYVRLCNDGPVEGRDVELVNGLGSSCRKRSEETAVEGAGEAQNGEIRTAG